MALDQKRLADLLAIARSGSFGRAAAARSVSQPALSVSIGLLEKAVGGPVLIRSRSGAKLTPLGEILSQHARSLELLLTRAETEARLSRMDIDGPLTVGVSPVAAARLVPMAIVRMKKETPRISVSMIEGSDDDLIEGLRIGEIDLIVGPMGSARFYPDIEETLLSQGPLTIIMQPNNPAARRSSVGFRDLVAAEWVLPMPGTVLRRRLEAIFLLAGVPLPAHAITTNSISAIKAVVQQSECVAIMAREMIAPELASGQLVALPISDSPFTQTIALKRWRHRDLSPLATRFVEIFGKIAVAPRVTQREQAVKMRAGPSGSPGKTTRSPKRARRPA